MNAAQKKGDLGREFVIEAELTLEDSRPAGGVAFNVTENEDGTQTMYAVLLSLGPPSTWQLRQVENSVLTRQPAWHLADLVPGRRYTVRVAARRYRCFEVSILAESAVVATETVELDPLDAQLAGGYAGIYAGDGPDRATPDRTAVRVVSSSDASDPPAPPPPEALVCGRLQGPSYQLPVTRWSVVSSSLVDQTQSLIGVGQRLVTHNGMQYAAYYNANREMAAAQRSLTTGTWVHKALGEPIAWDAHNAIELAVDSTGNVHVVGNMHNDPLVYFRTTTPGDIATLERVGAMVEASTEQSETYPRFLYSGAGDLIYSYRDGVSGSGTTYYNVYDPATRTWRRLFDEPLLDGQNLRNAYPNGPTLGPDGYFHLVWVWRDTGDAATNSHLSYARSTDLVEWETVGGARLNLPLTYSTEGVTVDPVPIYGGLINGIPTIGFDADSRVLISYWKFDEQWNTQVYVARPDREDHWETVQVSRWTGRFHPFGVAGAAGRRMGRPPLISPISALPDGLLQLAYSYAPDPSTPATQSGTWILDAGTLQPITEVPLEEILHFGGGPATPALPAALTTVRSAFPGMAVNFAYDRGSSGSPTERYVLRWEALPNNNDRPQPKPWPAPGPLEVYRLTSTFKEPSAGRA